MSSGQQGGNSQQPSQTWTEPPWCGFIETTGDALLILEAARRGLIPRVTRRLVDSERKMITSGSVFVFDEDESGIKRWTDGFFWSPSRILGNFLLYRETDKRGNRTPRAADADADSQAADGSLSRPKNETASIVLDKSRERSLCGSLTNSPKFKSDGLMKKTFSLTIAGVAQHLISYYKIEDATLPLLTDGHVEPSTSSNKRATPKRFLPYNAGTASRTRKRSKSQADAPGPITLSHSNSSSNSAALSSTRPKPPTYASDGSTPSYGHIPSSSSNPLPATRLSSRLLIASPQYPYTSYTAPPAVFASHWISEPPSPPQSQGTASPDHHPQAASSSSTLPLYILRSTCCFSTSPSCVNAAIPSRSPATSSAAGDRGNYAAPPPPAPGAISAISLSINICEPTMSPDLRTVPQRDRENSSSSQLSSDPPLCCGLSDVGHFTGFLLPHLGLFNWQ
ncbi:Gti1/Pac2 family-domain-containing protein [Coprinopsis sp. MPI-PUGE-AT-0042]|nr:Gti1/Pac2 family-domain-containing protein [Coprinopsis sp. MPI-PUGE-AT-0042]